MKSGRKHELETNDLAKQLAAVVEAVRPYSTAIVSGLLAVICLWIGYQVISYSRAAHRRAIWEEFSVAVEGGSPDLEMLRQAAEQHQGTALQEWSQITWADGQLLQAATLYLQNRTTAEDLLADAQSAYQSLISTADDPRVRDRAHFGLARVFEMRGELDKARQEYSLVQGAYAELASQRAEALESPEVRETYAWLATAERPSTIAPTGPGTPGTSPLFDVDQFDLPDVSSDGTSPLEGVLSPLSGGADPTGASRYEGEAPSAETGAAPEGATPAPGDGILDLPLAFPPTADPAAEAPVSPAAPSGAEAGDSQPGPADAPAGPADSTEASAQPESAASGEEPSGSQSGSEAAAP